MPITSLISKQYVGTTASSPPPSARRATPLRRGRLLAFVAGTHGAARILEHTVVGAVGARACGIGRHSDARAPGIFRVYLRILGYTRVLPGRPPGSVRGCSRNDQNGEGQNVLHVLSQNGPQLPLFLATQPREPLPTSDFLVSRFDPRQGYGSGHNRCYGCYGWLLITPHNTS